MKVDLNILNDYVERGLVERNSHPNLPLAIYNYSRTCQFERKWDDITKMCRGLILDNNGNIIAKGFDKFFNMEELEPNEIPNEPFEVFEKMDGSLGIFFYYEKELTFEERTRLMDTTNGPWDSFGDIAVEMDKQNIPTKSGEWILATKGSFASDQAVKGMEIIDKYNLKSACVPGFVYLFEIIYPENRIVVDYGNSERLVLLSIFKDGVELSYDEIEFDGWDIVMRYDAINDYNTLKSLISNDREGYVIRFKNGFRMKIKGEEYVRLHRILTGFSNVDIWEYLKDGKDFNEFLDRVPDEFDLWVKETKESLESRYKKLEDEYKWIFKILMRSPNSLTRKGFAEFAKKYTHPSILFKMFDNADYSDYIWKQIRPEYSKPFWKKEIDNG